MRPLKKVRKAKRRRQKEQFERYAQIRKRLRDKAKSQKPEDPPP